MALSNINRIQISLISGLVVANLVAIGFLMYAILGCLGIIRSSPYSEMGKTKTKKVEKERKTTEKNQGIDRSNK